MIIYNVTLKIETSVATDWLQWMKTEHIPEVLATNCFTKNRILRLLEQDDSDGLTFAVQYECADMATYRRYQKDFAPTLQKEHTKRYDGQFVAFRTLLEQI